MPITVQSNFTHTHTHTQEQSSFKRTTFLKFICTLFTNIYNVLVFNSLVLVLFSSSFWFFFVTRFNSCYYSIRVSLAFNCSSVHTCMFVYGYVCLFVCSFVCVLFLGFVALCSTRIFVSTYLNFSSTIYYSIKYNIRSPKTHITNIHTHLHAHKYTELQEHKLRLQLANKLAIIFKLYI